MGHRVLGQIAFTGFLIAGCTFATGCTRKEDAYGQLNVIIDSDVPVRSAAIASGEVDRVQVEVLRNNVVLLNSDWGVSTGGLTLPQTVALVNQNEEASEPVRFVLTGSLQNRATFVQERVLSVPPEGNATTVMRFEWLCRGVASTVSGRPNSGCAPGQTCRAGTCTSSTALAEDVAVAPPAQACFNQQSCFATSEDITARIDSSCSMILPAADVSMVGMLNVAIEPVVGQGGLCETGASSRCLVGLPRGEGHGWIEAGGLLKLPPSVCTMLQRGDMIARVWLSRACASRPATQPVCSPWITPG